MRQSVRKFYSRIQVARASCLSQRSQGTLALQHGDFLDLICDHGDGNIHFIPGKIADIILDNPGKRNALSGKMIVQLIRIIDEIVEDHECSSVILRGASSTQPSFCAGLDFSLAKDLINTPERGLEMCMLMTDALTNLRRSHLISLAAIHGPALGGGAELATACDFRLMSSAPATRIGFVHATIGASPGWGGGRRLVSIVGRSAALRLFGTAQRLSAEEAVGIGLADGVLSSSAIEEDDNLEEDNIGQQAKNFLRPFAEMKYPRAVGELKSLVASIADDPSEAEEIEKRVFMKRWGSSDNVNALKSK